MSHLPELTPVLTFTVGGAVYGLPVEDVVEVAAMVELVRAQDAPPWVLGVVNRHGLILPVLDLRLAFGLDAPPVTPSSLFIVASDGRTMAGLVVDEARQVEYFPAAEFQIITTLGKHIRGIMSSKDEMIQVISFTRLWQTFLAVEEQG